MIKHIIRDLVCLSNKIVFFLAFKKSAGTSDAVRYCDCRYVCDDEESHHGDLDESDHVREDHDDHCSAWSNEYRLVIFPFFTVQPVCI